MYYAEIENKGQLGPKAIWKEVKTEKEWKKIKRKAEGKCIQAYLWSESKTKIIDGISYDTYNEEANGYIFEKYFLPF